MREESHLEDMRSAIRGDFERLAKRRGEQELMSASDQGEDLEPEAEKPEAEMHEAEKDEAEKPEAEMHEAEKHEAEKHEPETHDEEKPRRRSWLSRLLSP